MSWLSSFNSADECRAHYRVYQPHPSLAGHIAYYWLIKCGKMAPVSPEFLLPDGLEELIFSYDSKFKRQRLEPNLSSSHDIDGSYFVGCKGYSLICTRTSQLSMVGVKFRPGVLYNLFGIPVSSLNEKPLALSDTRHELFKQLEAEIFAAKGEVQVCHLLDKHLMRVLHHNAPNPTAFALNYLYSRGGACSVQDMATQAGVSPRQLQKNFKRELGLSPKTLANIYKFKRFFYMMQHRKTDFAPLYYDQAHGIKIFRQFTHMSPGNFFKLDKKFSIDMLSLCLSKDLGTKK